MTKKRSKLLIVLDVLEVLITQGEVNPTRLATAVNMPYDRLTALLQELSDKGIVKINSSGRSRNVSVTPKGVELYEELRKIVELLRSYGLI